MQFYLLWKFNFGENVFVAFMFLLATAMFGISFYRVLKLKGLLNSPMNNQVLTHFKRISLLAFVLLALLEVTILISLYTQGYYGPWSLFQLIAESAVIIVTEVAIFIMNTRYNLELTLRTQVLSDGCIMLVGFDK